MTYMGLIHEPDIVGGGVKVEGGHTDDMLDTSVVSLHLYFPYTAQQI